MLQPLVDAEAPVPLKIELTLRERGAERGRESEIGIRMTNTSGRRIDIYNPRLSGLVSPTGAVFALLNGDGAYLGNALEHQKGSRRTPEPLDWVTIPASGSVFTVVHFAFRGVPALELPPDRLPPPGKYFVELRLHEKCIMDSPFRAGDEIETEENPLKMAQWRQGFPGPEICRSNRVELEILPRTGD